MTGLRAGLFLCLALLSPRLAFAEPLRIATYNVELQREGPGLLLRDLQRDNDPQIDAIVRVIAAVSPDVLAVQGFDWDHDGEALSAFAGLLNKAGAEYPHLFSARPNSGMATDLDLDGDGRLGGPGDAHGFGAFSGQGGLAVLSRRPIEVPAVTDLSALKWRDLPGALLPVTQDGAPFPSDAALAVQRLSSTAHWVIPLQLKDGGVLHLMTFQAGPPVFDGSEDRNGRRNHDEIALWQKFLDGAFGPAPKHHFVLAGGANLDPFDSDGRSEAIRALLSDARFHDAEPASAGATLEPDQGHKGANALDTVDWPSPGRMRVDYVLPSRDLTVTGSGVFWPAPDQAGHADALEASRHRMVWVDLVLD